MQEDPTAETHGRLSAAQRPGHVGPLPFSPLLSLSLPFSRRRRGQRASWPQITTELTHLKLPHTRRLNDQDGASFYGKKVFSPKRLDRLERFHHVEPICFPSMADDDIFCRSVSD